MLALRRTSPLFADGPTPHPGTAAVYLRVGFEPVNVRFSLNDVRFTPESGHKAGRVRLRIRVALH